MYICDEHGLYGEGDDCPKCNPKTTKDQELVKKIKPCPFILVEKDIGHNPYVIETDEGWHIQCTCGARSPLSSVKEYAVKNWNCRQHEWIPVSEKLPDEGQRYVALGIADGDTEYTSMEGRYSDRVGFVLNIKLWKGIPSIDNLIGNDATNND